ncbi:cytochrome-c oxidase/ electron carrier [Perilla frutescens var. frutescens]|nr:cytochrome-c oxidase/ electron carrier [Perilla frutescens var. frutescens]
MNKNGRLYFEIYSSNLYLWVRKLLFVSKKGGSKSYPNRTRIKRFVKYFPNPNEEIRKTFFEPVEGSSNCKFRMRVEGGIRFGPVHKIRPIQLLITKNPDNAHWIRVGLEIRLALNKFSFLNPPPRFIPSRLISSIFLHFSLLVILQRLQFRMVESETPFRPREKLIEKQKFFQSIHKHTYLKGPMDKLTSVAIPLALAGTSLFLIVSPLLDLHLSIPLYVSGLVRDLSMATIFQFTGKRDLQHVSWDRKEGMRKHLSFDEDPTGSFCFFKHMMWKRFLVRVVSAIFNANNFSMQTV